MAAENGKKEVVPLPVKLFLGFIQFWFLLYDLLTYIPFMFVVKPKERVARSNRTKAVRSADAIVDGKKCAIFEHVENSRKDQLLRRMHAYNTSETRVEQLLKRAVDQFGDKNCLGRRPIIAVDHETNREGKKFEKLTFGDYKWLSYNELWYNLKQLRNGLLSIHDPDANGKRAPLCIFAETRLEWMLTALACFDADITVVTVYATLGEGAIKQAIDETGAYTIVTTQELLPTIAKIANDCQTLKNVIFMERFEPEYTPPKADLFAGKHVTLWPLGNVVDEGANMVHTHEPEKDMSEDAIALIMYTSGTTGAPKGVMISHKNLIASSSAQCYSIPEMGEHKHDVFIAFLPLAHILEVDCEIGCIMHGVSIGYSSPLTLIDQANKIKKGTKGDCAALRPTLLAGVPAMMDRIYKNIMSEIANAGPLLGGFMRMCIERRSMRLQAGYDDPFLNFLVFKKIRALLGGRVRAMLTGGAPINPETQRFISICFHCPMLQGYGLTETTGAATLADAEDLSTGHVGPPLIAHKIMLREWTDGGYSPQDNPPSGEIIVGANSVSPGYWKQPDKTKEDFFDMNGTRWFCTGDIGTVEPDGSIRIIDRKKDLVKLCHGEYISLGRIETVLKTHPLADNVCIYGDSLQDHVVAIIQVNTKELQKVAQEIGESGSIDDLCKSPKVADKVLKLLNDHGRASGKLSKIDYAGGVILSAEPWTSDNNMLTAAAKLKRKEIAIHFKKDLERVYETKLDNIK